MDGDQGESSFLQLFWDLASVEEAEQLCAARKVILALKQQQAETEQGVCSELEYSLQRLVKGLASHRKGARQGYFIALTEILSSFPAIPLSRVYELIHTHLENVGKSQEDKGAYFGRVFTLMALIQSGRLTETADIVSVVKQLQVCAERKFYLQEFVAVAVCRVLGSVPKGVVREELVPVLWLGGGWKNCTPETLYVLLELNRGYEKRGWFKQLLRESWGCEHIVSRENFKKMVAPLLDSSSAHPRLHSVWSLVLEAVRAKAELEAFWNTVVDCSLCVSSHERKYLGLQLLEFLLPSLTPSEVAVVFSPTLLRCLVNHASSQKNYLHAAATHLLSQVVSCAKAASDPGLPVAVLLHLQARTASRFDQLSGTKTAENILKNLDASGIQQLLERLQQLFCDPSPISSDKTSADTLSDAHSVQLWAVDQIQGLVRNGKLARANSWLLSAAKFLFVHAFFTVKKPCSEIQELVQIPSASVEKAVQESCVLRFSSVLIDLSKVEKEGGTARRGRSGTMQQRGLLAELALFAGQLLSVRGAVAVREPFSDEDRHAWESASTLVATLQDQEKLSPEGTAFLLLLSVLILQLFLERARSREAIEELCVCYEEMQLSCSRTPGRKKRRAETSGPGWVEVFTDTLLGFLSQPSQLWRNVVDQAFRLVTHCITPAALELVLKVLEPQSKDDLMEADTEEVGGALEEDKSSDGESEEGSDEEEGAEVEGVGEVDAALRAAVKQALGTAAVDSDDEDSKSVSSLDDDAMMAIDEALAAAFRSRRAGRTSKKQKKDEKKSVVHFKLRVLDLIETFIWKEPSNSLVLNLFVPLYQLIHSAHGMRDSVPLATRATGIYRNKLCHLKKCPKAGVDGDHTHSQLQQLLQCQYKATPQTAALATDGCMLLLQVLRGCGPPPGPSPITTRAGKKRKLQEDQQPTPAEHGLLNVAMVTEWFSDALHDFITKKNSNVPHMLFTTYTKKYPALAWLLAPRMVEDIPSAGNNFRKVQVYEMLSLLLSQHTEEKVLLSQLPPVAPQLQAHCLTELAAAHQWPAKTAKPLLRLVGKLVALLKSHQELLPLLDADALVEAIQQLTGSPTLSADVRREGERVVEAIQNEDGVAMPVSKRRKRAKHRKKIIQSDN